MDTRKLGPMKSHVQFTKAKKANGVKPGAFRPHEKDRPGVHHFQPGDVVPRDAFHPGVLESLLRLGEVVECDPPPPDAKPEPAKKPESKPAPAPVKEQPKPEPAATAKPTK